MPRPETNFWLMPKEEARICLLVIWNKHPVPKVNPVAGAQQGNLLWTLRDIVFHSSDGSVSMVFLLVVLSIFNPFKDMVRMSSFLKWS